jgi:hypothetical protein
MNGTVTISIRDYEGFKRQEKELQEAIDKLKENSVQVETIITGLYTKREITYKATYEVLKDVVTANNELKKLYSETVNENEMLKGKIVEFKYMNIFQFLKYKRS